MKTNIPVSQPVLGEEETKHVLKALSDKAISGFYGEYIDKFEGGFARYCDCSYGVAVTSGTTALHLAVAALGIGAGDEVLVSTFTNMASCFSILYQGAIPVPVDIEEDTWNIDPALIEEKISRKTRAIMVVHIYGHPVDMAPILKIAKKHKLYVIEDAAEAHGALYKDKKVGSLSDVACFSFYANKIITTGEGGMLTTNNAKLAEKARSLKCLAFGKKNKFMHQDIGYNYRMTNIQAAIGYAQLGKIEKIIKMKRKIADYYNRNLKDVPGLQLPVEKDYARNVYWMYHVVLHKEFGCSRNKLIAKLSNYGIESREAFIPYNMQETFIKKGWVEKDDCPVANRIGQNGLYIPSGPVLEPAQLEYVVDTIKGIQRGTK